VRLLTNFDEALMTSSLTDDQLIAQTGQPALAKIIPEPNVVKIGGQSFILHRSGALGGFSTD